MSHPFAIGLAAIARIVSGVQVASICAMPDDRQRVVFANHSSHLDTIVLWSALPPALRTRTRPIAAQDYWGKGKVRRYFAERVFRALLIDRTTPGAAREAIDAMIAVLGAGDSLILFPEGTRGDGTVIKPFRGGLYRVAEARPDIDFVPAYLENLNRILPKGEVFPIPLLSRLTFGNPLRVEPGEDKAEFLERARLAIEGLKEKRDVP
jgi:1-acyl-sn-glycerol-3-phosphate acyltransferase